MEAIDRLRSGLFVRPVEAYSAVKTPASVSESPDTQVPLPLLGVSIEVDITGKFSSTTVTQSFTNARPSTARDATYLFPVYDGSVVTSFRCWIGNDRLLEGVVKPKQAAREEYQEAHARHKATVLVEELTPEIFETSVGNIPAQTTVKVEMVYTNLLKIDVSTGGLLLTIPTSVAPRYGTAPAGHNPGTHHPLPMDGLRITVQASLPVAIRKLESRTHPISVEMGAVTHHSFSQFANMVNAGAFDPTKARASLTDWRAILEKDLVLYLLPGSREFLQSQAIAESQPHNIGHSTVALTICPGDLFAESMSTEKYSGEVIFLVDRSGSMECKIPSLKTAMGVFLRSLPKQSHFNIGCFGSSYTWLWEAPHIYSQKNLDIATAHAATFSSDMGGTEILSALRSAMTHCTGKPGSSTDVILITDGEVWNTDEVIRFIQYTASRPDRSVRFFALGIGDQVSHRLVEGIGQQGGGYAEVISETSTERWEERAIQMLKAALSPSRLRCEATMVNQFGDKRAEGIQRPACIQAPYRIPVLNPWSNFQLYYMVDTDIASLPDTVTITATTDHGKGHRAVLPLQKTSPKSDIHHLAAKALMNDYETGQSWIHHTDCEGRSDLVQQEAERLGQQWSITSRWTSFVAVDRYANHEYPASLYTAERQHISELTRPRTALRSPMTSVENEKPKAKLRRIKTPSQKPIHESRHSNSYEAHSTGNMPFRTHERAWETQKYGSRRPYSPERDDVLGLASLSRRSMRSVASLNRRSAMSYPQTTRGTEMQYISSQSHSDPAAGKPDLLSEVLSSQDANGKFRIGLGDTRQQLMAQFSHEAADNLASIILQGDQNARDRIAQKLQSPYILDFSNESHSKENNECYSLLISRLPACARYSLPSVLDDFSSTLDLICGNILIIAFIESRHSESKNMWVFKVWKARAWATIALAELGIFKEADSESDDLLAKFEEAAMGMLVDDRSNRQVPQVSSSAPSISIQHHLF